MMAAALEIVQQGIMDYLHVSFMIAGHTKFSPDQLFSITARDFYSSNVFNESELIAVMENNATVVFDKGSIVRVWRRTVASKYSNPPGFRELHDFLALRNHGEDAAMKVRDNCYTDPLKNTPMKIAKGRNASNMALPCVGHSYYALGMVKELSQSKQAHLYQMCANFIPQDR